MECGKKFAARLLPAALALLALTLFLCGPKPGQKGYVNKARLTGKLLNTDGEVLTNIPVRFEVLSPVNPQQKGFLRTVTDSAGVFSFQWDELLRKESLKPMYILHVNYARDYLRNDRYEYKIQKCSVRPDAPKNVIRINPEGAVSAEITVGHHLWVEAERGIVRTGPSIRSEELAELGRATKVIMVEQKGEWCLVKIPTNDLNSFPIYDKEGWIYKPGLSEQYIPPVSYKERQRQIIIDEHPEWSDRYVSLIKKGKLGKGMSKEMVRAAMGDPVNTVVDDEDKNKVVTTWEYGTLIKKKVVFRNDQVDSWE